MINVFIIICIINQYILLPFIIEDDGLQKVIDFATSVKGSLTLSSRYTNQKYVIEESDFVAAKVAQVIEKECSFYSCTTDMWSSRHQKSFITLTHHFLNEEFDLKNSVLEIKEVHGSHTGDRELSSREALD